MNTATIGDYVEKCVCFGDRRGKYLAVVFFVMFLLLVLARFSAFAIWQEHTFDTSEITPVNGHAYITSYPFLFSDNATAGLRLKLYENELLLGPGRSHPKVVSTQGTGSYLLHNNFIVFSASDNSDPRTNNKNYKIRYPFSPSDFLLLLTGIICLVLNFTRLSRTLEFTSKLHPFTLLAGLVFTAFFFRAYLAINYWDAQVFGHSIKGVPFSDAAMWFNLGVNYEQGYDLYTSALQWDGRRHGYAWFLSALFNIFGESTTVVRFAHVLLGAISAGLVFDIVRRLLPVPLAVIVALSLAIHTYDGLLSLTTVSEPLGYFLNNLALWLLFQGLLFQGLALQGIDKNQKPRGYLYAYSFFMLSGLVFAYSNLVRPLTLGAILPLSLFVAWCLYNKNYDFKKILNHAFKPVIIFLTGIVIVISPWLARQYVTHDIFSITDNTAEMLYAASNPKYGTWSPDVTRQAEKENPEIKYNISERYRFYKSGIKTNMSDNFGWYIKNSLYRTYKQLLSLSPEKWVIVLCIVVFALMRAPDNKLTLVLLGMIFFMALVPLSIYSHFTLFLLLIGSAASILKRQPVGILAVLFLFTAISLGAMGTDTNPRFNYSMLWLSTAIVVWLLWNLMKFLDEEKIFNYKIDSGEPSTKHVLEKPIKYSAVILVILFLYGNIVTIYTHFYPKPEIGSSITQSDSERIIGSFISSEAGSHFKMPASNLRVYKSKMRRGFSVSFNANERFRHWSEIFASRNYDYTLFYAMPPIESDTGMELAVVTPRNIQIDNDTEYYFVGLIRETRYAGTFELVGMARATPKTSDINWTIADTQGFESHVMRITNTASNIQ